MSGIGYISAFDGLTIVGGSGENPPKAQNAIGDTDRTNVKMFTLPNGTVVNFDGTADAGTSPFRAVQTISVKSGAIALYDSLTAKKGNRGTATKILFAGGTPQTCTAVLEDVVILGGSIPAIGYLRIALSFAFEGSWA